MRGVNEMSRYLAKCFSLAVILALAATIAACSDEEKAKEKAEAPKKQEQTKQSESASKKDDKVAKGGGGGGGKSADERNKGYAAWDPKNMEKLRKEVGLVGPGPQSPYPKATFPGYLKKPKSIEEMMPQAQAAVLQKGGRVPLGLAEPGDKVLIVVPYNADPMLQEAIIRAFKNRKIEARVVYENDLIKVSKEDMAAMDKAKKLFKAGDGQQESGPRFQTHGVWADFDVYKKWVKEQDSVFYEATWPKVKYPNDKLAQLDKNYRNVAAAAVVKYLDENPEINRVYFRTGGRTKTKGSLKHHGKKFMGNYTYLNHYDLMSKVPNFPSDVWRMLEAKTIEPLGFADRLEATDPEGTALYSDITPEEANAWKLGSYQQGHLYMLPSQATGRYPYSLINYPAIGTNWLEPIQSKANGIIASTNSHATNHARIEVHIKDGYVKKVEGGGLYGDGFRLALKYPKINEATWPFMKKPGFFWLYEAGTGTNPKYYKHPGEILAGQNTSERNAGGVIHWSFGIEVQNGPEKDKPQGEMSPKTLAFGKENNLPVGHAMHNHNLLPTYQVRLRDSGKWLTLIEHGIVKTYNDPEVRALASRYGNPDELLRRDWIPEIPGITVAGDYNKDYAAKPGDFWVNWSNSIDNGSNPFIGK
jgi:hypothetical protein